MTDTTEKFFSIRFAKRENDVSMAIYKGETPPTGVRLEVPQREGSKTVGYEEINFPNTREAQALGILQEECAEVIQVISKINRFGLLSKNPTDPSGKTNLQMLSDEVGDVLAMIQKLEELNYLRREKIEARATYKHEKLKQYHPDL